MPPTSYLTEFKKAANSLDRNSLAAKNLEIEVGVWLESVVLRLQKKAWVNNPDEKPHSDASIFFSIWLNDESVRKNRIFYNIHALKLRQLRGYKITSREFAAAFRAGFVHFEHLWPNVSTSFGPLTLMQGWKEFDPGNVRRDVFDIAARFLEIDSIIDELLYNRRFIHKTEDKGKKIK